MKALLIRGLSALLYPPGGLYNLRRVASNLATVIAMSSSQVFPQVLHDHWHTHNDQLSMAIKEGKFQGISVSTLLNAFLHHQLQAVTQYNTSSLKSAALGKIITELKSTDDIPTTALHIAQNLDQLLYRQLLSDVRLPYRILRTFLRIPNSQISGGSISPNREYIEVEEAILAQEQYLRCTDPTNVDKSYLVTIWDLCDVLAVPRDGEQRYSRKSPPKGGGQLFESGRRKIVELLATDVGFGEAFKETSSGLLEGLDWANVMITGVCDCICGDRIPQSSSRM